MPARSDPGPAHRCRHEAGAAALLVLWTLAGCSPRTPPLDPARPPAAGTTLAAARRALPIPRSPTAAAAVPAWQAALRLMDRDGDGRVSIAEHAAAAAGMFERMDHDGDGRVTVDEMAVVRGALPDVKAATAEALHAVDANGDGTLDRNEHAAATQVEFGAVDADHDGYMSAAELQAADTAGR